MDGVIATVLADHAKELGLVATLLSLCIIGTAYLHMRFATKRESRSIAREEMGNCRTLRQREVAEDTERFVTKELFQSEMLHVKDGLKRIEGHLDKMNGGSK